MAKCPKCGNEVAEGMKFCSECGAQMPAPVAPKKKKTGLFIALIAIALVIAMLAGATIGIVAWTMINGTSVSQRDDDVDDDDRDDDDDDDKESKPSHPTVVEPSEDITESTTAPEYWEPEPSPEPITLTVWAPQEDQYDENSWLNVMLKKFEDTYADEYQITWVTGVCSAGDAATMVTTDVEAAADVYFFANDQIGILNNAQALTKLGGTYLEQVTTDNSQTFVDTVTYTDGGVYGFPMSATTWFMYYDKSVYTEEDVKSLDTMLAKGTVAMPICQSWYIWSFYAAGGGKMFGDHGVDASAGIQLGSNGAAITKYLVNLANNPKLKNDVDGLGIQGIHNGTINAMFSGSWDAYTIQDALGDNMGVAQLPTINVDGQEMQLKSFAGSTAIGVNRQSKNMAAALKLAAFLSSPESQMVRYELQGVTPAATAPYSQYPLCDDVVAVGQALTMEYTSTVMPVIWEMASYWSPADTLGQAIINGKVTLDNYVEQTELFEDAINDPGL